jgi:predicted transcriptional regulator of viral defense system
MKNTDLISKINQLGVEVFTPQNLRILFPNDLNIKVSIKRLFDRGVLIKITRGVYQLSNKTIDLEKLSTQIYGPSYVSFENALAKYGVINQGIYKITLATTRHSKKTELLNIPCEYIQIKPSLFFGFNLVKNVYIAEAEKAFLDEIYLIALGKRNINTTEWNIENLDKKKIREYIKSFPISVKKIAEEILSRL